jgi:hypothetical protein
MISAACASPFIVLLSTYMYTLSFVGDSVEYDKTDMPVAHEMGDIR